jgi:hypothetical protein
LHRQRRIAGAQVLAFDMGVGNAFVRTGRIRIKRHNLKGIDIRTIAEARPTQPDKKPTEIDLLKNYLVGLDGDPLLPHIDEDIVELSEKTPQLSQQIFDRWDRAWRVEALLVELRGGSDACLDRPGKTVPMRGGGSLQVRFMGLLDQAVQTLRLAKDAFEPVKIQESGTCSTPLVHGVQTHSQPDQGAKCEHDLLR